MACEKASTAATASVGQRWITSAGHGQPLLRFTMSGRQRGPWCIPLVSGTPSDSQPRPPLRWLPSPLGGVVWELPFPLKLYQNIFPWEVWFDQLALQFNSFMRNIPKYLYRGSIALPSLRPVTGLHMIRWSEPRLRQLVKFKSPVWTCSLQWEKQELQATFFRWGQIRGKEKLWGRLIFSTQPRGNSLLRWRRGQWLLSLLQEKKIS